MSQLGIGAMLHQLSGGSEHNPSEYFGKTIVSAELKDERLLIGFDDGKKIHIYDDGQSCCESRYITTDDDLSSLVGGKLVNIEAKDGPEIQGEWGESHEQVFVEVRTDKAFVTLCNHNEHNGYYGGFCLTIKEVTN